MKKKKGGNNRSLINQPDKYARLYQYMHCKKCKQIKWRRHFCLDVGKFTTDFRLVRPEFSTYVDEIYIIKRRIKC